MATVTAPKEETKGTEALQMPRRKRITVGIKSASPMIQHQWSEKAKEMIRTKHAKKQKPGAKEKRDPKGECEAATYRTRDGGYGIPLLALKSSIVSAAHKDLGVEKTLVRKSVFLPDIVSDGILPIQCEEPVMREDSVRVGSGADLRYRPEFQYWSASITFEVDSELMTTGVLLALIERAGFGVGICEWRPEKGGEFGRFTINQSVPVTEEEIS